jgi:hypothetical protein
MPTPIPTPWRDGRLNSLVQRFPKELRLLPPQAARMAYFSMPRRFIIR